MLRKILKHVIGLGLIVTIGACGLTKSYASNYQNDSLYEGYSEIESQSELYGIPFSMSFEEYKDAFEESGFSTTEEYTNAYLDVLESINETYESRSSSNGSDKWYYNIGTSLPSSATPKYSKYNLYEKVKKGDVIFEANGGFGITGHIAIVEGKYTSSSGKKYIRIIEAIDKGVVRSCLDDTRVDDKNVTVLRVTSATSQNINSAVDFCKGQLGKSYSIDFQKDTSSNENDWYCSELVWASYKNQGIDIEVSGNGEPGITPRDIYNSSKTKIVNFK